MKVKIIKPFIWNDKKISVGEILEYCTAIPEGHYIEVKEVEKVETKEKSKKDKKGFDEYD